MALKLTIRRLTRRTKCHVPGCKSRNALKITRRYDVNGSPLFLCPDCIRDIHAAYQAMEAEKQAQTDDINAQIEELTAERLGEKEPEAPAEEAPEVEETAVEAPAEEEKPKKPRAARSKKE